MSPIVRATIVLIEDGNILLVEENGDGLACPGWSLPGGKLESGETLEQCAIRETKEETGLDISVDQLLYLCDRLQANRHIVHVTFLVKRVGGTLRAGHGPDADVIKTVQMVPLKSLCEYGYSSQFRDLAISGFPGRGSYRGSVKNIGL